MNPRNNPRNLPGYNPRDNRDSYGYHRPPRYNPTPRAPHFPRIGPRYNVTHKPYQAPRQIVRYSSPRIYYTTVYVNHIYINWVFEPVRSTYTDGYWEIDDYPYYVDNGYRYRYTPVETCNYELVDTEDYSVIKGYPNQACTTGYDSCASERDMVNRILQTDRFFCAEKVDSDLRNENVEMYSPTPFDLTVEQQEAIAAYLEDLSLLDIFDDGYYYGVNSCYIEDTTNDVNGCSYMIKVGDEAQPYPFVDGSICSSSKAAARMNCNVGSQQENAGCILQRAIQEGYCH